MKRITTGSPFEAKLGYSRAVIKDGWCFVSGVTGYDYKTMSMPVHAADQARNCLKTIETVLEQGGFAMADIVRVTYILTDAALLDDVAPVLAEGLGKVAPAATMMIAGLIRPEMLIEIEVTALRD